MCCLLPKAFQTNCNVLIKAADLVTASIEILQEFHSDKEWDKLYKCGNDVAT